MEGETTKTIYSSLFRKGHIKSLEHRRRISETLKRKGIKPPSRRGIKLTEDHKEKIRRNIPRASENPAWRGGKPQCQDCGIDIYYGSKRCVQCYQKRPIDDTFRQKIRGIALANNYGKWMLGKKTPREVVLKRAEKVRGERNWNWQGGKTREAEKIRKSIEYKDWRWAVFERDNYTCVECGDRGGMLQADHIKPFAFFPELRLEISNGRTLCVNCHRKTETYLRGAYLHV